MAKVFYIPYGKYEIESDITKEELIANIKNQISGFQSSDNSKRKNKGKLAGVINSETGDFKIRKRLNYRNNFNPTLKGRIIKADGRSRVLLTIKLPIFSYIFILTFCILWAIFGISGINTLKDLMWPLGGIAFMYFLTFFGFNMGAGPALDTLYELV
jgi:hypothetical protein